MISCQANSGHGVPGKGRGVIQERPHQGRGTSAGCERWVNPAPGRQWKPEWASSGSTAETGVSGLGLQREGSSWGEVGRAGASCPREGVRRPWVPPSSERQEDTLRCFKGGERQRPCRDGGCMSLVTEFSASLWNVFVLSFQNIPQSTEILKKLVATNEVQSNIYT